MIPSNPFRSLLAVAAFAGALLTPALAEVAVKVPAPAVDNHAGEGLQKVVLAGGCFWGIQAVYQHTDGVTKAVSGYSGGDLVARQLLGAMCLNKTAMLPPRFCLIIRRAAARHTAKVPVRLTAR